MKLTNTLLPFCLLFALPVFSQEIPYTSAPDTIYVGADGTFDAEPDVAIVQFNISTQEQKLKPAYEKAQKAAEQVRDVLRNNGIDPKEATISGFRIAPLYDWKGNGKRKIIAYRVNSAVKVRLKDFSKVAAIADEFGNLEVTEEQSINYIVENTDEAKARAVENAMRRAKANAESAAHVGGRELGNLLTAKVDVHESIIAPIVGRSFETLDVAAGLGKQQLAPPPPPPPADFGAEKVTITAHVSAMFGLR